VSERRTGEDSAPMAMEEGAHVVTIATEEVEPEVKLLAAVGVENMAKRQAQYRVGVWYHISKTDRELEE
jgi:hypothetical protein